MRTLTAGSAPAPDQLEPLASAPLRQRFPHLHVAMDGGEMRAQLQSELLDGSGFVAETCSLPKADVAQAVCRIQYSLRVRTPEGDVQEVLVLGTMFANSGAADRFEQVTLAPLRAQWTSRAVPAFRPTAVIRSLGMAVSVFPLTDMLPTLTDVTDRGLMTGVLRSVLGPRDAAELARIELVRLRRTPRCVLRYWFGPDGHDPVFGKVGSTAGFDDVRRGLSELSTRVTSSSDGSVIVPTALGHRRDLDLTLFQRVPGTRLDIGVAAELDTVLAGAALAAASIHTSGVDFGTARDLDDMLVRARQAVGLIQNDAPALAGWLAVVANWLATTARDTPASSPVFAHGDLTLSQLLFEGSQVGVLDFDGLCQAEPEFDLGRFVSYLRVALSKSANTEGDELTARFLTTYRSLGGAPISETRVRLNGVTSLILMAVRSWQQLKPRRLQLVCAVLEREVSAMLCCYSDPAGAT